MLVRHRVADYAAWRQVFDAHGPAQREAGLHVRLVLRNLDDPGELFLLFEAEDLERARRFVTSSEVPRAQAESGVADRPDITFLSVV